MAPFIYGTPEKLQDGRYFVKIESNPMTIVNVRISKDTDGYSVEINDPSIIQAFESQIIDDASLNSVAWFKKEISRDVISNIFQGSLDGSNLVCEEALDPKGRTTTVFFDENKNIIEFSPDLVYTALVQLDGLWFLKRSFGTSWKIIQARAKRPQKKIECVIPDDDSD